MIVAKARETERLSRPFNASPSSSDCPGPSPVSRQSLRDTHVPGYDPISSAEGLRPEDTNYGLPGGHLEQELITLLDEFIG